MSWRPTYEPEDTVWVDRGEGVYLEGQIIRHLFGPMYRVAIAGQGVREVPESALSPRNRENYGPSPTEPV